MYGEEEEASATPIIVNYQCLWESNILRMNETLLLRPTSRPVGPVLRVGESMIPEMTIMCWKLRSQAWLVCSDLEMVQELLH